MSGFAGIDLGFDAGAPLGIGSTGFGPAEASAAISANPGQDAQGLMSPPAPVVDERTLLEKAAGWVVDKAAAKAQQMIDNPFTTAINTAFGFVPFGGLINATSSLLGGPTVGSLVTAAIRGEGVPGDVEPTPENTNNKPDEPFRPVRHYRYADGRIVSKFADESPYATPATVSAEDANYARG